MSMTKQEITRSAAKLFSLRGFTAVSIQDIADDCRIAKGSVYKYFPSKEDLFNEIIEQFLNRYFDEVERIKRLPGLSPKEHFLKQVIFRLQYFMEHKHILAEYNMSVRQDDKFIPLRVQTRGRMLTWHKECLLRAYGPDIEPYVWDLVFVYKALLKEFLNWVTYERELLSMEETAAFIIERLDGMTAQMIAAGKKPLLSASSFMQYTHYGTMNDQQPPTTGVLLDRLAAAVMELPTGEAERGELLELIRLLREETAKEQPNAPLIQALLAYLEREDELKSLTAQFKNMIAP